MKRRLLAAAVAGNALEFYDFVAYAFFAVYIGKTFFPASTSLGSLLLALAVFGVGFVTRPIGSLVIGAFADRAGRRPALLLTMVLMTAGTLGLAITPSYESIGVTASVVVVLCRLLQGAALGGELGPATAYVIESAPVPRRGLYASWLLASQGLAVLAAGAVGVLLSAALTPEQLQAWGWRLSFLVGLLIVPAALYLRRNMPETLQPPHAGPLRMPALGPHARTIVLATLMVLGSTVSTYVGNYMATYAIATLRLPAVAGMGATAVVGLVTLVFGVAGGWLADRVGRRPVMLWPRVALAILVVPAFSMLVAHPSPAILFAVSAILGSLGALSAGAAFSAIPELLPRALRATGLSVTYAVGVSIFGGSTQFVVTWLIGATGSPAAPAWYVAATSALAAAAVFLLPETRGRSAGEPALGRTAT